MEDAKGGPLSPELLSCSKGKYRFPPYSSSAGWKSMPQGIQELVVCNGALLALCNVNRCCGFLSIAWN